MEDYSIELKSRLACLICYVNDFIIGLGLVFIFIVFLSFLCGGCLIDNLQAFLKP